MSKSGIKIGPRLTIYEPDYVPNMQDAYATDCESGVRWINEELSKELNHKFPTVVAMAALIEKERDELKSKIEVADRLARWVHSFHPDHLETCAVCRMLKEYEQPKD